MKVSVLKADEKMANELFANFEKTNQKLTNGRKFVRKEVSKNKQTEEEYLKGSFVIRYVHIDNPALGIPVFRFLKTKAGNRIEWDERFCII